MLNTPQRIAQSIPHISDPEKLREIAAELERWSWWKEAAEARKRALEIERAYAEEAANK